MKCSKRSSVVRSRPLVFWTSSVFCLFDAKKTTTIKIGNNGSILKINTVILTQNLWSSFVKHCNRIGDVWVVWSLTQLMNQFVYTKNLKSIWSCYPHWFNTSLCVKIMIRFDMCHLRDIEIYLTDQMWFTFSLTFWFFYLWDNEKAFCVYIYIYTVTCVYGSNACLPKNLIMLCLKYEKNIFLYNPKNDFNYLHFWRYVAYVSLLLHGFCHLFCFASPHHFDYRMLE